MASSKSWSPNYLANQLWSKTPKANAELFSLTYGALIAELLRDLEVASKVNEQLDQMGYSMGIRCIEEFLSMVDQQQAGQSQFPTTNFTDCPDVLKMAFKMFLNVNADVETTAIATANAAEKSLSKFTLAFSDNPLTHFVELPTSSDGVPSSQYADLEYSQLLCGYCRGMLSALQFDVSCVLTQSVLKGDSTNQLTVTLNQVLSSGAGDDYHEE